MWGGVVRALVYTRTHIRDIAHMDGLFREEIGEGTVVFYLVEILDKFKILKAPENVGKTGIRNDGSIINTPVCFILLNLGWKIIFDKNYHKGFFFEMTLNKVKLDG